MMALSNCKKCDNPVSMKAKICPNCGLSNPSKEKILLDEDLNQKVSVKFIFVSLLIFGLFLYGISIKKEPQVQNTANSINFDEFEKSKLNFAKAMEDPDKRRLMECIGVEVYKTKPYGWTPPSTQECDQLNAKFGIDKNEEFQHLDSDRYENPTPKGGDIDDVDFSKPLYTKYKAILCPYGLSLQAGLTKKDIANVLYNEDSAVYSGCTLARNGIRVYVSDFGDGLLLASPNDDGIYPWITVKSQLSNSDTQAQEVQQEQPISNQENKEFRFYQQEKPDFLTFNMPSFDCNKAMSYAEKAICSNQTLAKMDYMTAALYYRAKSISKNLEQFKIDNKNAWTNRESCKNEQCIMDWYLKRTAYFSKIIMNHSLETVNFFTKGKSPVPYLRNANDSVCGDGKRNCTESEFQESYIKLKNQWNKMPEWIRKSCNTFMTYEITTYCIVAQTGLFKTIHPYHETLWMD